MKGMRVLVAALITSLLGAGCAGAPTTPAKTGAKPPAKTGQLKDTTPETAQSFTGQVLGLDGKPAANVSIRAQLVSNNGSGLVGNNSGGLVSNNGSGVVANNGSGIVSAGGSNYALLETTRLTAVTDAEGKFDLVPPAGQAINVEAVLNDETKAIQLGASADSRNLTLQLAPTGHISGKVTAPKAPSVTNFEGVEVFIPGTSYAARAAADGSFTISNVPQGAFTLVANHAGLGRAEAANVRVESKKTTEGATLALSAVDVLPAITAVSQPNGGPGTAITITGTNFGASKGTPFKVKFGGIEALAPTRKSDTEITVTVPDNGGSAGLTVEVGALTSAPADFKVIKTLGFKTPPRKILINKDQPLVLEALDSSGAAVSSPRVTWKSLNTTVLAVSDAGVVTPKAAGSGQIEVTAGTTRHTVKLQVVESADELNEAGLYLDMAGLAFGTGGKLFLAAETAIYELDADNVMTLYAGASDPEAADAEFSYVESLAADTAGNLYTVEDTRILKIAPDKSVTTLAGSTTATGNRDGVGSQARFTDLGAIAADGSGNLYVVDSQESGMKIRKITPDGTVSTLPGDYQNWDIKLAVDAASNLYVADGRTIYKVPPAGSRTEFATLPAPEGTATDAEDGEWTEPDNSGPLAPGPDGKLYAIGGTTVYTVTAQGAVSEVAVTGGPLGKPVSFVIDGQGRLRVADAGENKVITLTLPQ